MNNELKITTLKSKSGQMNMGGYFKDKTSKLDKIDGFTYCFRVYYVGDSCDECFSSLDEAVSRFNKISESIIL
jgi:hypothetical protein